MKINPLKAFANPAIPSQNPALNLKPISEQPNYIQGRKKALEQLKRGMEGKKR